MTSKAYRPVGVRVEQESKKTRKMVKEVSLEMDPVSKEKCGSISHCRFGIKPDAYVIVFSSRSA